MKVGMVIFRDASDEVSISLVSEEHFLRVTDSFLSISQGGQEDHAEYVRGIVEKDAVEHCHQQTFCLDEVDWSEYDIVGVHTLPEE